MTNNRTEINRMDREEILNTLSEVRYELAKVKRKLDNLVAQSIYLKEIHPKLDRPIRALKSTTDEMYETMEIEKWIVTSTDTNLIFKINLSFTIQNCYTR